MNEEEKRKYEAFQYWIQTSTERGVTTIPDNLCLFAANLIKSLQRENEELNEKILDNAGIYQLGFKDGEESYIKKVKDKIEELNRKIGKSIDNSKGGLDEEFIEKAGELLAQKRILQELLEGRKI